jgi:CubicO group peptidase (beta-lactamase class C family)
MRPPHAVHIATLLLLWLVNGSFAQAQEGPLQEFDYYVQVALSDWRVPGLAIAIVKNDAVVLAKGYGVRRVDDTAPVTARTLFGIGSATKAFTAASLAMLVDEGKITWDDAATKHLPGFQLYDAYVTRELTVRDLLSHRSGLQRSDLLWYGSMFGREEILRRVRYLKPTRSFRSTFGYQNIMYLAAGQIIPAVTGKSWDDFVRERIFIPLGMTASHTSVPTLPSADDVAMPHAWIDRRMKTIPWRNFDNIGPAGSITSNVVDMAQWLRLQLGEGSYQQVHLFSIGAHKEMQTPQTLIRPDPVRSQLYPDAQFTTYGLGWLVHDYRGRKVVAHGGQVDGMSAVVAMIPEVKLGVVILANMHRTSLPQALTYRVFDVHLGLPPRDWSTDFLKVALASREQAAEARRKQEETRAAGTTPSLTLVNYAGKYQHDGYGEAIVQEEGGRLILRYGPAFIGNLEHWHYDTFQATWRDRLQGKALVTFTLNAQGRIDTLRIAMWNISDLVFKRGPDVSDMTIETP